jgi:hypothetical protein
MYSQGFWTNGATLEQLMELGPDRLHGPVTIIDDSHSSVASDGLDWDAENERIECYVLEHPGVRLTDSYHFDENGERVGHHD